MNENISNHTSKEFNGKKTTDFHIEFIRKNIDRIMLGELNLKEIKELLNEEAIKRNEKELKSNYPIKRMIGEVLKDRPEDLKKCLETIRYNKGGRSPYKGKIGKTRAGEYYLEELKLEQNIIENYLPKFIAGEILLSEIEEETGVYRRIVNKIIEEHYERTGDEEGLKKYKKTKEEHRGFSKERRKNAIKMREEIAGYEIVSNAEFKLLSEEEQDKQIVMKTRSLKLKRELTSNKKEAIVLKEETVINIMETVKNYLRSKNNNESKEIYFSEEDIRHMLFTSPTIMNRTTNTLEKKIENLLSYEEISEKIAYSMVKSFPQILEFSVERTKRQLDLLKNENLMDYAINKPSELMRSPELMYALIQFAKKRHQTNDLSNIIRSNIFMANAILKRTHGITSEELKELFPYNEITEEDNQQYSIDGTEIGKASFTASVKECDEAQSVLENLIEKSRGGHLAIE